MGRAMLRPLIWRQTQIGGGMQLTVRLPSSIRWFADGLRTHTCTTVLYSTPVLEKVALVYTDSEGTGQVAAVLVVSGSTLFWIAKVTKSLRNLLHPSRT